MFHYNICVPYNKQRARLAQLVGNVDNRYWDLGSIPRSPLFLNIVLFNVFPCSVPFRSPPCTLRSSWPRVPQHQSNGHDLESTMDISQTCHTRAEKVKQGQESVGLIACYKPPKGPTNPPLFVFSSLYSFPFFILF